MRLRRSAVFSLVLLATAALGQQPTPAPASPGMPPNMEMYPLGFLKKGPKWTPEKTEQTAKIQEGHMAHLNSMAAAGKLVVAGPVGAGAGDLRGILVFKGITIEEAVRMASEDPAVKAGRLIVEIVPWWVEKGVLP
ncbi:MAG TPA: YciI family protein [Thermoanaerobaculia bacterium]|jgi:uncharacterized protein YciI